VAAGWQAGMPHLPLGVPVAVATCGAGPAAGEADRGAWPAGTGAWRTLLRASGRLA